MASRAGSWRRAGWRVVPLDETGEGAYERLATDARAATSQTLVWREVLRDIGAGEPVYWIAYSGGDAWAALPAFVRRSKTGGVLNSLPFYQSKGGVIAHRDLPPDAAADVTSALVGTVLEWCRSSRVDVASVVVSPFASCLEGYYPEPDFAIRRAVQALDLTEAIAFRHSVWEMIRKAERHALELHEATSVVEARLVYDLYADNMLRMGVTPSPWSFHEALYRRGAGMGIASYAWAALQGEPLAALVLTRHGGIVDYFAVGSTERGRQLQANSWLCYHQILAARERGDRWWNWMPSPTQQVHDFKKRWGGREMQQAVIGWRMREAQALRESTRDVLADEFPGYFVMPYEHLIGPT